MNDACRQARIALLEGAPGHEAHVDSCADCQRVAEAVAAADEARHDALQSWLERPLSPPPETHSETRSWRLPMATTILVLAAAAALATPLLRTTAPTTPSTGATGDAAALNTLVEETASLPWNALGENEWGARAEALRLQGLDARDTLTGPQTFAWLAQLGRAGENANQAKAPYYGTTKGLMVNVPWAVAACLPDLDEAWLQDVSDPDLRASVNYLVRQRERLCPVGFDRLLETEAGPADALMREVEGMYLVPEAALTPDQWATRAKALRQQGQDADESLPGSAKVGWRLGVDRMAGFAGLDGAWNATNTTERSVGRYLAEAACLVVAEPSLIEHIPETKRLEVLALGDEVDCSAPGER